MEENKEETPKQSHIFAGLAWAEHGFPFYLCVLKEKSPDKTQTFYPLASQIEVIKEEEAKSFPELTNILSSLPKLRCSQVYARVDKQFYSFIKDINLWKRTERVNISLRATKSSSLEGSLLKIYDLLLEKKLTFPEDSLTKEQLRRFSKGNLEVETDKFYTVKAISLVIDVFTKPRLPENKDKTPILRGWW